MSTDIQPLAVGLSTDKLSLSYNIIYKSPLSIGYYLQVDNYL